MNKILLTVDKNYIALLLILIVVLLIDYLFLSISSFIKIPIVIVSSIAVIRKMRADRVT
jgi:hypothetical protein